MSSDSPQIADVVSTLRSTSHYLLKMEAAIKVAREKDLDAPTVNAKVVLQTLIAKHDDALVDLLYGDKEKKDKDPKDAVDKKKDKEPKDAAKKKDKEPKDADKKKDKESKHVDKKQIVEPGKR